MEKIKNKKLFYRIISIISIIGFIGCSIALLYPVISDRWNRYRDAKLVTNYNDRLKELNKEDYDSLLKLATDYNDELRLQNRSIITDANYDPDSYYESLLNLTGNSMMGYIEIPKIDITEPIYHYSTEISLGKGIGHIHGSSLPVGGNSTHSVLTGHRGLPNQKFFSDLDKIDIGDRFYIHVLGSVLAYEVYEIREIAPTDVEMLFITEGKDLLLWVKE
jgi:sortase A